MRTFVRILAFAVLSLACTPVLAQDRVWETSFFLISHPESGWRWDQRAYRMGTMMFIRQGKGNTGGFARPFMNFETATASLDLESPDALARFIEKRYRDFERYGDRTVIDTLILTPRVSWLSRWHVSVLLPRAAVAEGLPSSPIGSTLWADSADIVARASSISSDSVSTVFVIDRGGMTMNHTYDRAYARPMVDFFIQYHRRESNGGMGERMIMVGHAERHPLHAREVAIKLLYWYLGPDDSRITARDEDLAEIMGGIHPTSQ